LINPAVGNLTFLHQPGQNSRERNILIVGFNATIGVNPFAGGLETAANLAC
jgi:hypothetical protein